MIFGRGGGGGVINRVTKEAGLSPIREFTATGGSFYDRRFTGDIDQPFGDKAGLGLMACMRSRKVSDDPWTWEAGQLGH